MKYTSVSSLILRAIQEPFVLNTFEFCTIRENKLIVMNFLSVGPHKRYSNGTRHVRFSHEICTCTLFSEANNDVDRKRVMS